MSLRSTKYLLAVLVVTGSLISTTQSFNLFEFLERKFNSVRPVYQPPPPPQQKVNPRHYRPRQPPVPRWPQLQYNYDQPNLEPEVIEQQPQQQSPPPSRPQQHVRPPHYESYEPEQPVDVPVVVGTFASQPQSTRPPYYATSTLPPTQAPSIRYLDYEDIEIITAPPLGGHRHYGPTYEVQVGTNFNTRQK